MNLQVWKYCQSNGGDGISEAIEQFLGKDWEELAELGQILS